MADPDTSPPEPSPRAGRPKWPILTMLAVAAGILISQWIGAKLRGPVEAPAAGEVEPSVVEDAQGGSG